MTTTAGIAGATQDEGLQHFVLEDVDWQLYDLLLEQIGDRHIFVTFDDGRLELMSPSFRHEMRGTLLSLIVDLVAEELDIPIIGGGSTTFRRKDLKKGLEPDKCFYVQHVSAVIDKEELDLASDPPPDLVIEVEVSRRAVPRMPIYAALGVPEIWRVDGHGVRVFTLAKDRTCHEREHSLSFPMLPIDALAQLLAEARGLDQTAWMKLVRRWARENLRKD